MQDNLIDQGFNPMLFGMGTVFVFLTVLVFATTLMSKLVSRFATPQVEPEAVGPNATIDTQEDAQISPQIMTAIKSAIDQHRKR